MQRTRSKITRDVRLVFDIFVDKATGATPGQSYIVQYERGERERGTSETAVADAKGEVRFSFHSAFVSTFQRKSSTQYSKKNFRIFLTEHPGGMVVADTTYDLSSTVENEIFPCKTFLIRSKEKALKLTFTLSGMSEEDVRKVNNRRSLEDSGPASPSVTRPPEASTASVAEEEEEQGDPEPSPSIRRNNDTPKGSKGNNSNRQREESDDDLFAMVDSAVAEKSARSEARSEDNQSLLMTTGAASTTSSIPPTPNSTRSGRNNVTVVAPSNQRKEDSQTRPTTQQQSKVATAPPQPVATAPPPSGSAFRSPSPPPPAAAPAKTVAPATTSVSQKSTDSASSTTAPPPPAQKSVSPAPPPPSDPIAPTDSIESIALSIKREASVEAATASRLEDHMAQRRDEAEVRRVLSEVLASIVTISNTGSSTTAANANQSKTKSNLKIPNPAMLIIHCLRTWNGPKRTLFLHDLICVLYCDAAMHSRYTAEWFSVILHVLYDVLVMEEGRMDGDAPLSQNAVATLTSDVVDIMEHAARSNFGSANTFAIRGSRSDSLSRIFPTETASLKQKSLSQTEVVLLCAALDDSLRKLLMRLHTTVLHVVDHFCHAPAQTVTRHTENGFKFTGAVDVGGSRHGVEDPSISVVLHTITDLHQKLHLGDAASPLVQLVSGEIFRTIFSNINTAFLNHMVDRTNPSAAPTLRVNTPKRGIQFKLCLSMLETWLQQRRMFSIARTELLPCRQFCDLVLLPKVALRNIELREQTTSRLPAALVLFTLKHIQQPSSNNKWAMTEEDIIPQEVIELFTKLAKEQRAQYVSQTRETATKYLSSAKDNAVDEPPVLPYRTYANLSLLPFLVELVPKSDTRSAQALHNMAVANQALLSPHMTQSERLAMDKRSTNAVMDWEYSEAELQTIAGQELVAGGKGVAESIFQTSFAKDSEIKEALVDYSL